MTQTFPLWGDDSVGLVAAVCAALVGGLVFAVVYVRASRRRVRWRLRARPRRILDILGLTLTAAGMALLLVSSVFAVLGLAFRDLELDPLSATVVVVGTVGGMAYVLGTLAVDITTPRLAVLLGLFLIGGVLASMLTAETPDWWRFNFSALGMGDAVSASIFNVTVIVAGVVLATLADYLTVDLHARGSRAGGGARDAGAIRVVRTLLVVVGAALVGVGAVPVSLNATLHVVIACLLLTGFAALIVAVPSLVAGLPRSFLTTTTVFVATLGILVLLFWPIGYLNLTALELLAVAVVFAWLTLFTRAVSVPERARVAAREVAPPRSPSALPAVAVGAALGAALTAGACALAVAARRRR